jgi:ABC-type sugar transport system ATPase subunit
LLDEPLSNIDALLRLNMRVELKRLADELGQTIIYSTHDQAEASSMGHRIAVIYEGVIHQIGNPTELYNHPVDMIVARTVGSPPINLIECLYEEKEGKSYLEGPFRLDVTKHMKILREKAFPKELTLGVRPEHITVSKKPVSKGAVEASLISFEPIGSKTVVHLTLRDGTAITAVEPPWSDYSIGEKLWIDFNPEKIHIIDRKTGKVLV